MKLAIFDFDGTIYKKETFSILMDHLKQYPKRYRKFYSTILPIYIGYKLKLIPEMKMKSRLMYHYTQALNELDNNEVEEFFANVYSKMRADFNPDVIEQMSLHHDQGYTTYIISGAFTPLLTIVAKSFHIDHVIGTDIPASNEIIDHVHAERKVARLMELINKDDIDWNASYAYGDSIQDKSILELVGNPIAVEPDLELQQLAKERKWKIIY